MKLLFLCKPVSTDKWLLTKTLRIMKIAAFFILIGCLQVNAKGFGQINLSLKNVPLQTVFAQLREQTGYSFFYDLKEIKAAKPVSVEIRNKNLEEALTICLKEQPLTFTIIGKTVVIKPASIPPNTLVTITGGGNDLPPPTDISGKVTNEKGEPLEGVTVRVKGTKVATATNAAGEFYLPNIDENATLIFTSVNVEPYELKVAGKKMLTASLKIKVSKLDDIQVMAYRNTTRRLSTGNVSAIGAKEIESTPSSNPILSVEGRLPGVTITQQTGFAGGGARVTIQGINSINSGIAPLYIIDGVPYNSSNLDGTSSIQGTNPSTDGIGIGGPSPLSFINPQDIENISVLKDAAATSIYGSRGANGVILINTKKGKAGATKIELNIQQGVGKIAKKMEVLNTAAYLALRKQAYINDGVAVPTADSTQDYSNYDLTLWDQNRNTDWQKELLGGNAGYSDIQLSVSGGSPLTQFRVSGNYHRETTIIPGDFKDNKVSLGFNLNHSSANNKLNFQFGGNYQSDNNSLPNYNLTNFNNLINAALTLAPNAPSLYKPDGTLNWEPDEFGESSWQNPLALITNQIYNQKVSNLVANTAIKYAITPNLFAKVALGYTDTRFNAYAAFPSEVYAPEIKAAFNSADRSSRFGAGHIATWQIEPQLNYRRTTAFGKFDIIAGAAFLNTATTDDNYIASGFTSDLLLKNIRSAAKIQAVTGASSLYRYNAFFGQINYNLKDKYIVELSARRDGSSRFGTANRFANFGAVSGAWLFSAERFMKGFTALSYGKIKASIGTTGNDQIGNYSYADLYASTTPLTPYQGQSVLSPSRIYNPYLKWELTTKISGSVDLGFFKDRLLINATYFRNQSGNQILSNLVPLTTGFTGYAVNFPATVQNSGYEFTVNSINFKSKSFQWSTSFNLTIPRSKLIKFDNIQNTIYANTYIVGEPVGIRKLYKFAGVNPTTGLYQFESSTGTIITGDQLVFNKDNFVIIDPNIRLYGGLENVISYKNFSLSFLVQFRKLPLLNPSPVGLNVPGNFYSDGTSIPTGNVIPGAKSAWTMASGTSGFQRTTQGNFGPINRGFFRVGGSDAVYDLEGYYLRLKNAVISYTIPKPLLQRNHIENVRVFVQGQNIATKTNYTGLDPETQNYSSLPPLRTIVFGLQVSL